jgi:FkbM family methyltransferase
MIVERPSDRLLKIIAASDSGHLRIHFSQLGEDAVLWNYFHSKFNGFYVDVGCHHPYRFSNTALLSMFNGWRGINIDVDERAISSFESARPGDINLCTAVGKTAGTAEATFFEDGALNSLDNKNALHPEWAHIKRQPRTVPVTTLREILATHLPLNTSIDLLNVDVEGFDNQVLESNDWKRFRPGIIAVESHDFDLSRASENPTFKLLSKHNYKLASHIVVTSIYELIK